MYNKGDSVLLKDGEVVEIIDCKDEGYVAWGWDDMSNIYHMDIKENDIESVVPF